MMASVKKLGLETSRFEVLSAYHRKSKSHLEISSYFRLEHESLRARYFIDFESMIGVLKGEVIEAVRLEFLACIAEGYALSTIACYIVDVKGLVKLVKETLPRGSGPVGPLTDDPVMWKVFWAWLCKKPNMKMFLVRCNGDGNLLWGEDYGPIIQRLSYKAMRKDGAVLADPKAGAYTESEIRDITFAVCKGFEDGYLELEHLATFFFVLLLGYRHSQVVNIKVSDVTYYEELKAWRLRVELIKQKNKGVPIYNEVRLPTIINTLLDHLVPICRRSKAMYLIHRSPKVASRYISTRHIPEYPDKRCNGTTIMKRLESVIYNLGVRSPRSVGGRINLTFVRFKHTMLTRAAVNGASMHEIMFIGMHSSLSSARSYIDSIPAAQDRIREELGPALSSIAKVFLGVPYEGGYEQAVLEMPDSIRRHYGIAQAKPIGVCGSQLECTDHAPIACLLCPKFQPFRDAPFGEYRNYLIGEMSEQPSSQIKKKIMEYVGACEMWISKLGTSEQRSM